MLRVSLKQTGAKIRELRIASGYSVEGLRQAMKELVGVNAIYKWEHGQSLPSIDNMVILADLFGVTIDEIVVTEQVIFQGGNK